RPAAHTRKLRSTQAARSERRLERFDRITPRRRAIRLQDHRAIQPSDLERRRHRGHSLSEIQRNTPRFGHHASSASAPASLAARDNRTRAAGPKWEYGPIVLLTSIRRGRLPSL